MTVEGLSGFQIVVARIFFDLEESVGYVVAGGAGLLASDLITRPTLDLDFFAAAPIISVEAARDALITALDRRGWTTTLIHDNPEFCRLVVAGDDDVLVDLALDSPPVVAPKVTILGPTLAPLELTGRKMLALFGRAEIRDFADVYRLAAHFGKQALLDEAAAVDPGFNLVVLTQMMSSLDRFDDEEFPIASDEVAAVRAFFVDWVGELSRRPPS